jgi:hypothetical protein
MCVILIHHLNNGFSSLLENLQTADLAPTVPTVAAAAELQRVLAKLVRGLGSTCE